MIVALTLDCTLQGVQSLKEKRSVMKSVMERAYHHYRVSIAEIDFQNLWQRTIIEVAYVTNDFTHGEKVMQKVIQLFDQTDQIEIIQFEINQV